MADIDLPQDSAAVIQACKQARVWLREDHDIGELAEARSRFKSIYVNSVRLKLGPEAVLAAQEIQRRTERQLGLAIRRGEAETPPNKYVSKGEWWGGGKGANVGMGALSLVTDEAFEVAVRQARAAGDLTRSRIIRRIPEAARYASDWVPTMHDRSGGASARRRELIRNWAEQGYSSRQMSERLGINDGTIRRIARETGVTINADPLIYKTRVHDQNRIVREAANTLEAVIMGLDLVDTATIDPAEKETSLASLTRSSQWLNRFLNKTRKDTSNGR